MSKRPHLYCGRCDRIVQVKRGSYADGTTPGDAVCTRCGDPIECSECGYSVTLAGNCWRPDDHFVEPDGTVIPRACTRARGA